MLKTSDIKSMARILRDMKNPPVEEDTDKDKPGTQGDHAEYQKKREEIAAKFGVKSCSELEGEKKKACYAALDAAHVSDDEEDEDDDPVGKNEDVDVTESFSLQATMALGDAGIMSRWKKGKLYVARKDIKKAEKALAKSFKHMKKGAEPDLWHEEVEIDEGSELDKAIIRLHDLQNTLRQRRSKEGEGLDDEWEADQEERIDDAEAKIRDLKRAGHKSGVKLAGQGPRTASGRSDTGGPGVREEVELNEADKKYPPTIETLKMIVKDKQNQVVKFKDGNARVDGYSASAMTQVYDAMKKPDLKKKFEETLKTKAGFLKIQSFAFSMVK